MIELKCKKKIHIVLLFLNIFALVLLAPVTAQETASDNGEFNSVYLQDTTFVAGTRAEVNVTLIPDPECPWRVRDNKGEGQHQDR